MHDGSMTSSALEGKPPPPPASPVETKSEAKSAARSKTKSKIDEVGGDVRGDVSRDVGGDAGGANTAVNDPMQPVAMNTTPDNTPDTPGITEEGDKGDVKKDTPLEVILDGEDPSSHAPPPPGQDVGGQDVGGGEEIIVDDGDGHEGHKGHEPSLAQKWSSAADMAKGHTLRELQKMALEYNVSQFGKKADICERILHAVKATV